MNLYYVCKQKLGKLKTLIIVYRQRINKQIIKDFLLFSNPDLYSQILQKYSWQKLVSNILSETYLYWDFLHQVRVQHIDQAGLNFTQQRVITINIDTLKIPLKNYFCLGHFLGKCRGFESLNFSFSFSFFLPLSKSKSYISYLDFCQANKPK